jgi:excinuclease UvrABC ATPase subunit
MPAQVIKISGARQHNLKNLHVVIPREKLVVITGFSASGKSSLTFDTLYAEGQRQRPDGVMERSSNDKHDTPVLQHSEISERE